MVLLSIWGALLLSACGAWRSNNATFFETSVADQPHIRGPDVLNVNVAGFAFERSKSEDAGNGTLTAT
jgi:hypothetical protein